MSINLAKEFGWHDAYERDNEQGRFFVLVWGSERHNEIAVAVRYRPPPSKMSDDESLIILDAARIKTKEPINPEYFESELRFRLLLQRARHQWSLVDGISEIYNH